MPGSPSSPVPPDARRARAGVALFFFTNGALFANLLPRYPAIKDGLELTNAAFGLAVAAFPIGALLAGLTDGVLVRRLRSSRVALVGTLLTGAGVLAAGIAPSWAVLVAALFVGGAMDAVTDVAQNSHGLRVQGLYRRSILNSFHAVWSIGAVTGGLMGGAAAGLALPAGVHLGVSLGLFAVVAIVAYRLSLPGPEPAEGPAAAPAADAGRRSVARAHTLRWAVMLALVLVAGSGAVVEDAGATWAAVYLSGSLDAPVTVAALGFVALQGMQFVGRLLGDGLVDRFGQRAVARSGGAITAVGMGLALAFPSAGGTIAGFGAAGLGIATLIPAAMQAADRLPGLRPGTGLAVLSWLMRAGFLLSPPLVGVVADALGLRVALLVVPLAGLVVVVLASVLSSDRRRAPTDRGQSPSAVL